MKKLVLFLSVAFLLTTIYTIAPADVVPGAVLYLDAADNPEGDDAWTNLGTAGGELSSEGNPPVEDEGTIAIPALNAEVRDSKFYTFEESTQGYGGPGNTVELFLEDWTIEALCRRNGGALGEEHQFAGFQNTPAEGAQSIRLWMVGDQNLDMSIHAGGGKQGVATTKLVLEEGVWTWIAIASENGNEIRCYQDGEEVSNQAGFDFDPGLPIDMILIGANSYGERARTFNGSVSIVRVYDKPLTEEQINKNIEAWISGVAVEPVSKLTTTWGTVKTEY